MFLTEEFEKLVHLIASAFAKAHGSEDPTPFADTVLEHAKALAEPAAEPTEPAAEIGPVVEAAPVEHTGE